MATHLGRNPFNKKSTKHPLPKQPAKKKRPNKTPEASPCLGVFKLAAQTLSKVKGLVLGTPQNKKKKSRQK